VVPALAVVQHGVSSGPLSALVAADAALHRNLTTPDELGQALIWVHQHPRSAPLKAFLALADGRRESPGETRLAHALHLMKVEATPQYEIKAMGFSAVVDFRLHAEKVVLEFDGQVKYGRSAEETDPYGRRLTPQQVVWLEKQREDRIRELDYEVVRVIWSELDDLVALARRIAAAVRRARTRRLGRLSA
jgi:very-short-patch-repair endonuclease